MATESKDTEVEMTASEAAAAERKSEVAAEIEAAMAPIISGAKVC
jgi:hypothetical protein